MSIWFGVAQNGLKKGEKKENKGEKGKREKRRKKGVQRSVKIARFGQCF